MCEVEVVNVTTQYCWLYPVHNTQWDTTLLKKVLKSDDKKVGQRFISWELLDPTPLTNAFKIIYTHLAWPFVAAALHNHSSQVASLKGGFINLNGVHLP
jgi:hypothetical protein